jgi:hypothetical protein
MVLCITGKKDKESDEVRSLQANHREHGRWYAKPLEEGASEDYAYVFKGLDATLLACQKAQELNEEEGQLALAA